jgi:hypothetical protein
MKKLHFYLLVIYIISLGISFLGYLVDSDESKNAFVYEMFEVFMMSLLVFGFLMISFSALYFLFRVFKSISSSEQLVD